MGQARAVVERPVADVQERAGEAQHGDAGASVEGIVRYGGGAGTVISVKSVQPEKAL